MLTRRGLITALIATCGCAPTGVQTLIDGYCQRLVRCQESPITDLATCEATSALIGGSVNGPGALAAAVKAGKVQVDENFYASCAAALSNLSCDRANNWDFDNACVGPSGENLYCDKSFVWNLDTIPGCAGLFEGTVASGSACITTVECPSGEVCFAPSGSCGGKCIAPGTLCNVSGDCLNGNICANGTCAAPDPAAGGNGDSCGAEDACQSGLTCLNVPAGDQCLPISQSGGPCNQDAECADGLVCGASGTCGASTNKSDLCDSNAACAPGYICVPPLSGLAPNCMPAKMLNDSCTATYQCGGEYSLYYCDPGSMKCVTRPTSGTCPDSNFGFSCDWRSSYCDGAACQSFKAAGASCMNDDECGPPFTGASCSSGSCVGPTSCSP